MKDSPQSAEPSRPQCASVCRDEADALRSFWMGKATAAIGKGDRDSIEAAREALSRASFWIMHRDAATF